MNGGEHLVCGYSVDGYIEIPTGDSEDPYKIVFEYMGCFYHTNVPKKRWKYNHMV